MTASGSTSPRPPRGQPVPHLLDQLQQLGPAVVGQRLAEHGRQPPDVGAQRLVLALGDDAGVRGERVRRELGPGRLGRDGGGRGVVRHGLLRSPRRRGSSGRSRRWERVVRASSPADGRGCQLRAAPVTRG